MGPIVLAAQLQNPFGFDRLDLDIALFGMRLHKETCCIANAGQVRNVGYNSKMTFLNLHKVRDLRPKADGTVEVEEKKSEKENEELSKEEEGAVRRAFDAACTRVHDASGNDAAKELGRDAFASLVTELISANNANGGSFDIPSDSALQEAFDVADADESGLVDEEEFLELYRKLKAGAVLRGGFFSGHHRANILASKHVGGNIDGDDQGGERMIYLAGIPLFRLPVWLSKRLTDKSKNKNKNDDDVQDEIAELADDDAQTLRWAKRLFREVAVKDDEGERGLDRDQFRGIIHRMVEESNLPSDNDLERAFLHADADNSGAIDKDEFMALVKALLNSKGTSDLKLKTTEQRKSYFFNSSSSSPPGVEEAKATEHEEQNSAGGHGGGIWETHVDEHSGETFYYNAVTGETSWHHPEANWQHHTGGDGGGGGGGGDATAEEDTEAIAEGIAGDYASSFHGSHHGSFEMMNPFVGANHGHVAESAAESAGDGQWESHVDEASGKTFFYNVATGETSWEKPH